MCLSGSDAGRANTPLSPEGQSTRCHFLGMPEPGCTEGRSCSRAPAARGCLPGGVPLFLAHSWWSCRQLEPRPARVPSPKSRVPKAGHCCLRVTSDTLPAPACPGRWDQQPAPACEHLIAALAQFAVPGIAPLKKKKITDSSLCSRFGQVLRTSPNFLLSSRLLLLSAEDKLSVDDKISDYNFHTSSPPRLQCLARGG